MNKWEYFVITIEYAMIGDSVHWKVAKDHPMKGMGYEEGLEYIGERGWELVNGQALEGGFEKLYFKRPIEE